jgi:mRNA interferase MazF
VKQVFYVPERGDVVWLTLSTKGGRSPAARRPAVVLSPQAYNARVGLAILCPVVALVAGYPFEVPVPPGLPVAGAILADQTVSLDWPAHRAERICSLPSDVVLEVLGKVRSLLE